MLYLTVMLTYLVTSIAAFIDPQLLYRRVSDKDSRDVASKQKTQFSQTDFTDDDVHRYVKGEINSPFLDPNEATHQNWESSELCAGSKFKFASIYGNHMVLQSAPARAVLWGYADKIGDLVTVKCDIYTYTTHTFEGPTGVPVWQIELEHNYVTNKAQTITATSGSCTITLQDVLYGDVWICSGQSNMVFPVSWVWDPKPLSNEAPKYPTVRIFQAALAYSNTTLYDLKTVGMSWMQPTPDKIMGFSAVCWMYGMHLTDKLKRPIGLIQSAWGGTRVEAWSSPRALKTCFPQGPSKGGNPQNMASYLWNAMMHPFINMTIYGVIWYQGEANVGHANDYACAFPEMIKDWRQYFSSTTKQTDPEFPFGFVQIAPNEPSATDVQTAELRFAQTANYGYVPNPLMPRVFMAVTIDLPDFNAPYGAVHPRYKLPVGLRLSLAGLTVAYNEDVGPVQGPFHTVLLRQENIIFIGFDQGHDHLDIRSITTGYEICCSSHQDDTCMTAGTWTNAPVTSYNMTHVILGVKCGTEQHVTGVRYEWRESPCPLLDCAIYRVENNLPAPPFIYNGLIGG